MVTPDHVDDEIVPNPLKSFLNVPGGISEKDALQRATDSLEMIRHEALENIDASIARIGAYVASSERTRAAAPDLHQLGNNVSGLAGMFGLPELGAGAYCLCELIDAMESRGVWTADAIAIHYDAMCKLREPRLIPPEGRDVLLEGLRKVTKRIASGAAIRAPTSFS